MQTMREVKSSPKLPPALAKILCKEIVVELESLGEETVEQIFERKPEERKLEELIGRLAALGLENASIVAGLLSSENKVVSLAGFEALARIGSGSIPFLVNELQATQATHASKRSAELFAALCEVNRWKPANDVLAALTSLDENALNAALALSCKRGSRALKILRTACERIPGFAENKVVGEAIAEFEGLRRKEESERSFSVLLNPTALKEIAAREKEFQRELEKNLDALRKPLGYKNLLLELKALKAKHAELKQDLVSRYAFLGFLSSTAVAACPKAFSECKDFDCTNCSMPPELKEGFCAGFKEIGLKQSAWCLKHFEEVEKRFDEVAALIERGEKSVEALPPDKTELVAALRIEATESTTGSRGELEVKIPVYSINAVRGEAIACSLEKSAAVLARLLEQSPSPEKTQAQPQAQAQAACVLALVYEGGVELLTCSDGKWFDAFQCKPASSPQEVLEKYLKPLTKKRFKEFESKSELKKLPHLRKKELSELHAAAEENSLKRGLEKTIKWSEKHEKRFQECEVLRTRVQTQLELMHRHAPEWLCEKIKELTQQKNEPNSEPREQSERGERGSVGGDFNVILELNKLSDLEVEVDGSSIVVKEFFREPAQAFFEGSVERFLRKRLDEEVQRIAEGTSAVLDFADSIALLHLERRRGSEIEVSLIEGWSEKSGLKSAFVCASKEELASRLARIFSLAPKAQVILEVYENGFRARDYSGKEVEFERVGYLLHVASVASFVNEFLPMLLRSMPRGEEANNAT